MHASTSHLSAATPLRPTGVPPSGAGPRSPRLRVDVAPAALAASRGRHPSSQIDADAACGTCGFSSPARGDTAEALRSLPSAWRSALQADPNIVDRAAFLRDEVHAVANRVARVLDEPGARLSIITIQVPTLMPPGIASTAVVLNGLRLASERLARLVESLRAGDWELAGLVRAGSVTVTELIRVPLHHSHRDLMTGAATGGAVVRLHGHRRAAAHTVTIDTERLAHPERPPVRLVR